jgi:antibiotic biosynthesis monooxygenase (ABM) superfamily enzyme
MERDEPITVVVRHRVKPGKESEFEGWRRGISLAARRFEGHLGSHVLRPASPGLDYVFLFRFDTLDHLERWEQSETRREWLGRLAGVTAEPVSRERHSGMEVWFTPPAGRVPPPRYKMVVATVVALYPLVSLVQWFLSPHLAGLPFLARTFVSATLLVSVMTYFAMPLSTRLLAPWLYGAASGPVAGAARPPARGPLATPPISDPVVT